MAAEEEESPALTVSNARAGAAARRVNRHRANTGRITFQCARSKYEGRSAALYAIVQSVILSHRRGHVSDRVSPRVKFSDFLAGFAYSV